MEGLLAVFGDERPELGAPVEGGPADPGEGGDGVIGLPSAVNIGALNLFRTEAGELAEPDRRAAQALADVATIGILQ